MTEKGDQVLCNDSNGLCLLSNAELDPATAGAFTTLLEHAAALAPEMEGNATILIETDTRNIVVRDYDGLTVAVFRKHEGAEP
mmetsp:Transcript_30139/g.87788  ORF Transcript_30139/g.87788 Transcript_30139/m.87788 type:complete len:83 (-) Transcript_30139:138-386(-)|eukprot:CAMPEP_0118974560 /NCGR_PEP_ID=MMETSP1173-20130426/12405_1 /TAXON_ID=1034831 /ORGANISM="Rhizochromulina marina cf, Strain CCMP1243" /LENGTH=82 /DNA_ID=CAMNT_0006924323 /DNA_START=99 /DNA_END=347 /DNA_ORIENTATION=+